MAWLVIIMQDNSPHEAGDIISMRSESDAVIGLKTLQNPMFRIVHCPDMPDADAIALTQHQASFGEDGPDEYPYRIKLRAKKFNVKLLSATDKSDIDAPHKDPSLQFTVKGGGKADMLDIADVILTTAKFMAAVETKSIVRKVQTVYGLVGRVTNSST